jgi:multidrug efflux pump
VNIDFVTREITYGAPSTQWWTQLSAGIVFGLAFATVLTLIVTPCALMARQTLATLFGRLTGRKAATQPVATARLETSKRAEAAE